MDSFGVLFLKLYLCAKNGIRLIRETQRLLRHMTSPKYPLITSPFYSSICCSNLVQSSTLAILNFKNFTPINLPRLSLSLLPCFFNANDFETNLKKTTLLIRKHRTRLKKRLEWFKSNGLIQIRPEAFIDRWSTYQRASCQDV